MKEFVIRKRAVAEGRVQGVGFRPFVWRLARELELTGHTRNTSEGVVIEIEGKPENLDEFERRLTANPPPLARITSYKSELIKTRGDQSFVIKKSDSQPGRKILVSPDIRICSACLADIRDPANPRFGYPFANCTDCGPRYTITASLPYDRATTTMACFPLCDRCEAEYENPADRRFHAQPVACPDCGPKIWYADVSGSNADRDPGDALKRACELILNGGVLALKGLGGFQLVCDARSEEAVARLREAKNRPAKPFAVMTATTDDARLFCDIDENEARLLESPENPIVLLKKNFFPANPLAASIAPDTNRVGVMLPTTPLHAILLDCLSARGAQAPCLIATSGNSAGEPICLSNREASGKLKDLADGMLFHNRDILVRVDDSVVSVSPLGNPFFFRRARGFAPQPVETREKVSGILGMGAYLKSTFCLTRDNRAFLSQHIGELDSPASREFYEHTLVHMIKLLETEPRLIIRDLHPDFLSSRLGIELARERDLPIYALQHHAAHAFAVLAERKIYEPSIALCLDGSGYGEDGTIQGGEILEADLENASWRRIGGLSCFPMPGGEKAIREPWRLAAALADNRPENIDERKYNIIREMVRKNLNSPLTSSAGRLFDAVSARLGLCAHTSYEGQAAIRLEKVAQDWLDSRSGSVPAPLFSSINARSGKSGLSIDARAIFRAVDNAIKDGRSVGELAAAFHRDLAFVFARVIGELAERRGVKNIILSGGVFNNRILFATLAEELKNRDLSPLAPSLAPAGDGAISLGQAAFGQRLAALGKIALK